MNFEETIQIISPYYNDVSNISQIESFWAFLGHFHLEHSFHWEFCWKI